MELANPQSYNRYVYVNNQPTNFVDPSGLQWVYQNCHWYAYFEVVNGKVGRRISKPFLKCDKGLGAGR